MSTLRTRRMEGRPVRPRDASFAAALFGHPQVGRWTGDAAPRGRTQAGLRARAFAAHWTAHGFGLRLWRDAEGPAGLAGLQFCVLGGAAAVEASFAFAPDRWGRGLAAEAMTATLAEAAGICAEVQAVVREGNDPALALLRRLGFAERASILPGLRRFARAAGPAEPGPKTTPPPGPPPDPEPRR